MKRVQERYEEKQYDFIVVGDGMSGLCAALEATRNGVITALIHARHAPYWEEMLPARSAYTFREPTTAWKSPITQRAVFFTN
ncbi:MAG: FAD-binding protein [Clostridia bacterium]|nr:FAD-binding protein [Clostridia bacterium]